MGDKASSRAWTVAALALYAMLADVWFWIVRVKFPDVGAVSSIRTCLTSFPVRRTMVSRLPSSWVRCWDCDCQPGDGALTHCECVPQLSAPSRPHDCVRFTAAARVSGKSIETVILVELTAVVTQAVQQRLARLDFLRMRESKNTLATPNQAR